MIQAVEAIRRSQLNTVTNGEYTVNYQDVQGGSVGVLSCNPPDGHFTIAPAGTEGPYERCRIVGASLVFSPPWSGPHKTYIVPYVADSPNA